MKNSFAILLMVISGFIIFNNIAGTSSISEADVGRFLKGYNKYMAILKHISFQITYGMEAGWVVGRKKRMANLLANRVAESIRKLDRRADMLYEEVKKSRKEYQKDIKRQLMLINQVATPKNVQLAKKLNRLLKIMGKIYSEARVPLKFRGTTKKLQLNRHLMQIMKRVSKRTLNLIKWAWNAWRRVVGPKIRPYYVKFVQLANKGAQDRGYKDYGEFTRSGYDMDEDDFRKKMAQLFSEVKPLYKKLHAYVRFKLRVTLGSKDIEEKGMIPAQYLGMWPGHWTHLYNLMVPFPKKKIPNVSKKMKKEGLLKKKIIRLAEKFFVSIGFKRLPKTFWKYSLFKKKAKMPCQASSIDIGLGDVRMKMPCLTPSQENLVTAHHEMGHIQYYLSYVHQPFVYRLGANQGFQESVGDTIALSITTPKYLHAMKLIDRIHDDDEEDINYLMKQALHKVSFLPFSYMIELWRWDVFAEKTPPSKYNSHWWDLRNTTMGVKAPVKRTDNDFDPGAFLHIDKNIEYISYFFSQILQYMIQKSLCKSAGHKGPLHKCSIYGSKEAGKKLKKLLSMGRSEPWQKVLEVTLGENDVKSEALLEYYKPLETWLDKHREKNGYKLGW